MYVGLWGLLLASQMDSSTSLVAIETPWRLVRLISSWPAEGNPSSANKTNYVQLLQGWDGNLREYRPSFFNFLARRNGSGLSLEADTIANYLTVRSQHLPVSILGTILEPMTILQGRETLPLPCMLIGKWDPERLKALSSLILKVSKCDLGRA